MTTLSWLILMILIGCIMYQHIMTLSAQLKLTGKNNGYPSGVYGGCIVNFKPFNTTLNVKFKPKNLYIQHSNGCFERVVGREEYFTSEVVAVCTLPSLEVFTCHWEREPSLFRDGKIRTESLGHKTLYIYKLSKGSVIGLDFKLN